jgi:hypothetical protein
MNAGGSVTPEAPGKTDFHLVESPEGWTLTISLSSRMLDALMDVGSNAGNEGRSTSHEPAADGISARQASPKFTVHVEPNLVSGDPFDARVVIIRPPV